MDDIHSLEIQRKIDIRQRLLSFREADFTAFCLTFLEDTYRQFSSGMDRTEKINKIIEMNLHQVDLILDKIERYEATQRITDQTNSIVASQPKEKLRRQHAGKHVWRLGLIFGFATQVAQWVWEVFAKLLSAMWSWLLKLWGGSTIAAGATATVLTVTTVAGSVTIGVKAHNHWATKKSIPSNISTDIREQKIAHSHPMPKTKPLPNDRKSAIIEEFVPIFTVIRDASGLIGANYSHDGSRIVIGGAKNTAQVLSADTGRVLVELKGHTDILFDAIFSPDNRRIVTVSQDGTARIWDAETGRMLAVLNGHDKGIIAASYSPDGRQIVTVGGTIVRIWDASSAVLIAELKVKGDNVYNAMFSKDGRYIVAGSTGGTQIWAAPNWHLVRIFPDQTGKARYSPDGRRVVTHSNKTASIWDALSGRLINKLNGHKDDIFNVRFSPDGRHVVTASDDQTARVWDAETGRLIAELIGHQDRLWDATFSPDGRYIATTSFEDMARVWDAETGYLVAELKGHNSTVWGVSYSPIARRLVTAGGQEVRLWAIR